VQYDLEWVRETVAKVKQVGNGRPRVHKGNARVHPNGFIQLDLIPVAEDWHASYQQGHSGSMLRLHIWEPPNHPLPHQGTVNEIHTHVFDMHSTIIRGTMEQRLFSFAVGSEWHEHRNAGQPHEKVRLYRAVYNKASNSRLEDTGIVGVAVQDFEYGVHQGQSYDQPAFTFHDSVPRGCVVTVMEKTVVHEGDAYVLCPIGNPPDNEYDRQAAAPEEYLWEAIEEAIA